MGIERISEFWPSWKPLKLLGKGGNGEVYKCVHEEMGVKTYSAIKVIDISSRQMSTFTFDTAEIHSFCRNLITDCVNEINVMLSLKNCSNIVGIEDFKVVEIEKDEEWEIFIRMELLTCLTDYLRDRVLTQDQVVKLGIDLCTALELCHSKNIMHRDIKPANVFVNEAGVFKLGDFGIARTLEAATAGFSHKGTLTYVAPEVMYSNDYTKAVDIYSLGLVLYQLANKNRLPFVSSTDDYTNLMQNDAVKNRLMGDVFPPACNADESLNSIIRIACEYKPENRFQSVTQMKTALEALKTSDNPFLKNEMPTINFAPQINTEQQKQNNNNKKLVAIVISLCVVAIIILISIFAIIAYRSEGSGRADGEDDITASHTDLSDETTDTSETDAGKDSGIETTQPGTTHQTDPGYAKNYIAYLRNPSGKTRVYLECGVMSPDHWISGDDPITIHEVYTDGCCKVSYVTDGGVIMTYLAKIVDFTEVASSNASDNNSVNGNPFATQNSVECKHKYSDATCLFPRTCIYCGATTGSAKGHSYKAATCKNPKTCTVCGVTSGTVAGHSWKEITENIYHDEEGHYEYVEQSVRIYLYRCPMCGYNRPKFNSLGEYYAHFDSTHAGAPDANVLRDRYDVVEDWGYETVSVWVVDRNAYTETVVTGHKCSVCGKVQNNN